MSSSTGSSDAKNNSLIMYSYIILLVFSGTVDSIAKKTLNIAHSLGKKFKHPFFVSFLMFLGEVVCLIFYYIAKPNPKPKSKENEKEESIAVISHVEQNVVVKPELSIWMLLIPAFLDFMATTINTIGLTMMTASSYQMMRGASILFVAILARTYLKSKLYFHNYFAIFLVMTGLLLIGSANSIIPPIVPPSCSKTEEYTNILGYILLFISTFFVASQLTIEEEFTKNYNCHPLKAVGWEGVFGSLFYVLILSILQFVRCTPPPKNQITWTTLLCTQNEYGEWRLEDSLFAIRQNLNDGLLLVNSIVFSLSVAVINFAGVTVTKIASAGARSITEPIRTITIWCFFMLPIVNHCHREHFNIVQFIGFLFLIAGNLIYNKIVNLPYFNKIDDSEAENNENKNGNNYNTIQELTKSEKA